MVVVALCGGLAVFADAVVAVTAVSLGVLVVFAVVAFELGRALLVVGSTVALWLTTGGAAVAVALAVTGNVLVDGAVLVAAAVEGEALDAIAFGVGTLSRSTA